MDTAFSVPSYTAVMVVEDDSYSRDALSEILSRRGFHVVSAGSGDGAVLEARRGSAGIFLMDIDLGGGTDGIAAARGIQNDRPLVSFIFVTAHGDEPVYRQRVKQSGVRVGGWVDKPFDVDTLVSLIEFESLRLRLLEDTQSAASAGIEPLSYLKARARLDPRLQSGTVHAVREEVQMAAVSESRPQEPTELRENSMASVSIDIVALYDSLRALAAGGSESSAYRASFRTLRAKLDGLLQIEADLLEKHYLSRLSLDPERAARAERRAQDLIGRYWRAE